MSDKSRECLELAVYGKGGIGKSTVSANLSAALAMEGRHVMQIGCDPKHDSTRLLMHGESIPTVLDYLRTTDKERASLSAVLKTGCFGIGCIEAGGPKPGVGCAGRGIISSFEFLQEHQAKRAYDLILYDVLGDVVCGGFAVPVRREYADAIFLVTSGEYMALYAANNILRGIRNYDGERHRRVAGIIYNERRITDEDGRVERFARAVGLPICAKIPRSNAFARAEEEKRTLMELEGGCEKEQAIFRKLARRINGELMLYPAEPLSDEELERVVLQTEEASGQIALTGEQMEEPSEKSYVHEEPLEIHTHRPVRERAPLYGCAFNGAATAAVNLRDALIIAHSPKACAFYTWQNISSPGRKNLFNRGILMPSAISPHFACTDMKQSDVVFGGMDSLRRAVREAMERAPGAVVIISSCVSGIIGDDIRQMEELSTPETPVITIPADGDIAGDYMEGIRLCMHILADRLIDPSVKPGGRAINLIGETGVSNNRETNYRILKRWMDAMGIAVNCRFLGEASCADMKNFLKAPLNVLAADNAEGRELREWLTDTYGCTFGDEALPIGFEATKRWLLKLGKRFDCTDAANGLIANQEQEYRRRVERLKPLLGGKRIFMTTINTNMDWLLEVLGDLEMEVVFIGVLNYLTQPVKVTDHPMRYTIDSDFNGDRTQEVLDTYHPDIVLANYVTQPDNDEYFADAMPMSPVIGFYSGIEFAERWASLMKRQRKGGWMNDRAMFEKYYA